METYRPSAYPRGVETEQQFAATTAGRVSKPFSEGATLNRESGMRFSDQQSVKFSGDLLIDPNVKPLFEALRSLYQCKTPAAAPPRNDLPAIGLSRLLALAAAESLS